MEYGDDPISIANTGIYRVKVDMSTKTIKWTQIVQVQYCMQHLLSANENLAYMGNGVWKVENKQITFATADWGYEERFRFNVTVDGEDYTEEIWGQRDDNREVRPESIAAEPTFWYLFIRPRTGINDYSYTWKFPLEVNNSYVDLTVIMTATEDNYRQEIELK
ncbi:MAG: hypothetical protein LUE10_03695 [Alistipes sp.]|nr:hypothetical protein [Alistipes sp.]